MTAGILLAGVRTAVVEHQQPNKAIHSYFLADAASRATRLPEVLRALAEIAANEGPTVARQWARLAVSPVVDYSSLMQLRKFVVPSAVEQPQRTPRRIAILGGPTTNQLRQAIEVFLAADGIVADVYEAEYGLFRQEILDPRSPLGDFGPEIVFLATSVRDVLRWPDIDADAAAVARLADEEIADWEQLWQTAHSRWNATLVQNDFETPPGSVLGHFGLRHAAAPDNYVGRLNRLMAERAPAHVVLHDLHGLAGEVGARHWFDPRFYHQFKMPCSGEALGGYAHSVASVFRAILGRSKKVVVLDLDNTLWGGTVGDVGAGGITFGQGSGEGEAFLAFQKYLKSLQRRGIVLAVCSKNHEANAREPFESRDDMILKLSDFACFVADFNNKADNLRIIADRLALNPDSFVFVDDNPAERALVRRCLPDVAVPDMPDDPAGYVQALASHRYFETISYTREDTGRARCYAENAKRRELASAAADVDSFLSSLQMRMRIAPINDLTLARATQLINKSNQFNLTTRRYSLAQIQAIVGSSEWRTFTFSLCDNLGDNGLISVILARREDDALAIDTWVMSCRVLQRGVEICARNELVEFARCENYREIRGEFIPTPKNALVENHYAALGFAPAGVQGDATRWSLHLKRDVRLMPHHIQCERAYE